MTSINDVKQLFPERLHDSLWLVGGTVREMLAGGKRNDLDLVAYSGESDRQN